MVDILPKYALTNWFKVAQHEKIKVPHRNTQGWEYPTLNYQLGIRNYNASNAQLMTKKRDLISSYNKYLLNIIISKYRVFIYEPHINVNV